MRLYDIPAGVKLSCTAGKSGAGGDQNGINKNERSRCRRACRPQPGRLLRAAGDGSALKLAADYINDRSGRSQLPNIAGFCRSVGVSVGEFESLRRSHPDIYGILCAVFEDEALNSDVPASVLTLYLRGRLDYNEKRDSEDAPVTVVFDHDVFGDGE